MTDNEIIKALGCCGEIDGLFCNGCTYKSENDCVVALARDAHDLINRQKAEIDRLNHIRAELSKGIDIWIDIAKREMGYVELARAEAIKEFVERLRTKRGSHGEIWGEDIDNLVKEITEETST